MRKKNGFTIIEMLSTIVIITVISTVVVYSVITYINTSKENSNRITMESIKQSSELYIKEFDNKLTWITDEDEDKEYICISIEDLYSSGFLKQKETNTEDDLLIKIIRDKENYTITNINIGNKCE